MSLLQQRRRAIAEGLLSRGLPPEPETALDRLIASYKRLWTDTNALQKVGMANVPIVSDVAGLLGDVQQYVEQPEQRSWGNYGMSALGLLPFMPNMTVFHGSPHKWLPESNFPAGRPRLDKIGTGEGAQAYGHGIYFAEAPGVAQTYAETGKMPRLFVGDKEIPYPKFDAGMAPQDQAMRFVADTVQNKKVSTKEAVKAAREILDSGSQVLDADKVKQLHLALDELENSNLRVMPAGEMYTLDLPDEKLPALLDWDKTLSEQPETVRKALVPYWKEMRARAKLPIGQGGLMPDVRRDILSGDVTGERIWKWLESESPQINPSQRANELGIPGLRYLDAGSRAGSGGTSNFVIWDQGLLNEMGRRMAKEQGLLTDIPDELPSWAPAERMAQWRTARANAALPVELGGLGLGPANTAAERAAAAGFDTPVAHATAADIAAFDMGKASRTAKYGEAAYLGKDPERMGIITQAIAKREGPEGMNMLPLLINKGKSYDAIAGDYPLSMMMRAPDENPLRQLGYDSVEDATQFAVFNPANIRSRFAAFDPKRRNEADLLASIAPWLLLGTGALGAGLLGSQQYD